MARTPSWEGAYCEFFAARQRPLVRTAYAILGSWPAAEDAAQTTLTQLYTHWPRIQPGVVDAYARRTHQLLVMVSSAAEEFACSDCAEEQVPGGTIYRQTSSSEGVEWHGAWLPHPDGSVTAVLEGVPGTGAATLDPAAVTAALQDRRLHWPLPAQ